MKTPSQESVGPPRAFSQTEAAVRTKEEHLSQAKHLRRLARGLPIDQRQRAVKLAALNEALARVQNESRPAPERARYQPSPGSEEQHVLSSAHSDPMIPGTNAKTYSMDPVEKMREALEDRMLVLLNQSEDPEPEMDQLAHLVWEAFQATPSRANPKEFSRGLFEDGPGTRMSEMALKNKLDPESAESAEDLLLRLLPSDGHLD